MKKIIISLFALAMTFGLVSCKEEVRTYVCDGEYTAFEEALNYGAIQLNTVTVTIENDEIKSFYIDAVQGVMSVTDGKGSGTFNEKSKKELGYEYKMHYYTYAATVTEGEPTMEGYEAWLKENNKLEWFEQAALIEAYMVENGADSVTSTDGVIDNITGVTIKDSSYSSLAKEAVELAKAGKVQAVIAEGNHIVFATATVNAKGELSDQKIDELQGSATVDGDKATWAWNEKTKQELGYDYKMHYWTYAATVTEGEPTMAGYEAWLKENNKLEWFEQERLITAFLIENGADSVTSTDGKIDNVTGVTIKDTKYSDVYGALLAKIA